MNYEKRQVNDALNAFRTIEEGLRAYRANKIYSRFALYQLNIDIVKQYIKGQRDKL